MTTVIKDRREAYVVNLEPATEVATITLNDCVFQVMSGPPSDPTRVQTMRLIEESGTLDFWNADEEDIYTENDGQPL